MDISEVIKNRVAARALFGAMCLLAGGLVFGTAAALADNDPSTQTVLGPDLILPYEGYLMMDSKEITGERKIKFELFESLSATNNVWEETVGVKLYNGRFSVGLGTTNRLTDTILDAQKLWLGMTILENQNGVEVAIPLSGRQAIEPAPYAAWSGSSANFSVAGKLTAAKGAEISGPVTNGSTTGALKVTDAAARVMHIDGDSINSNGGLQLQQFSKQTVSVGGFLNVKGTDLYLGTDNNSGRGDGGLALVQGNGDQLLINFGGSFSGGVKLQGDLIHDGRYRPIYEAWDSAAVGNGGATIVNDNGTYKALMIAGNTSDGSGTGRKVHLYDDVTVNDELTVKGALSRKLTCPAAETNDKLFQYENKTGRLCMYEHNQGERTHKAKSIKSCWDNYGADLCTGDQVNLGMVLTGNTAFALKGNFWMSDRTGDRVSLNTDASASSNTDMDRERPNHHVSSYGAYCCIKLYNH